MVGVEDLISETVAVKEAGVSARTLQRFNEAGYLTVQVKSSGERFYSRTQLHEIFGSFQEPPRATPQASTSDQIRLSSSDEDQIPSASTSCTYYSPVDTSAIAQPATVSAPLPSQAEASTSTTALYEDYVKAKNLIALQERILDMKDGEIADLRSQRDWLRARVEKLEEKGDRDQVLLLSETQALRQLISLQQKRPSTVRNILEWLGLAGSESVRALPNSDSRSTPNRENAGGTILVNKAANE